MFNEEDEKNYYVAFLALDGYVYSFRMQNGYMDANWHGYYGKVGNPKGSAEFELANQDGKYTFFVNEQPALTVTDTKVTGKSLGIAIHSGTNKDFGMRCIMKNIDLWKLD